MKRRFIVALCTMVFLLAFSGCSSKSSEDRANYETAPLEKAESLNDSSAQIEGLGQTGKTNTVTKSNQKLIRTVDLSIETKEYDQMITAIYDKIDQFDAYVENSESYGRGYDKGSYRNIYMTIRVPKASLDAMIDGIIGYGTVTRKTEKTEDVTLNYVDTESRIKALKLQQDKLFEYLDQANGIDAIIKLEDRINEVTYQLESYSSKLRAMDNQVDYSTLQLSIEEVDRETKIVTTSRFKKMTQGFVNSLIDVIDGILDFIVGIVIALPYLLLIGVITGITLLIINKRKKSKKAKDVEQTKE